VSETRIGSLVTRSVPTCSLDYALCIFLLPQQTHRAVLGVLFVVVHYGLYLVFHGLQQALQRPLGCFVYSSGFIGVILHDAPGLSGAPVKRRQDVFSKTGCGFRHFIHGLLQKRSDQRNVVQETSLVQIDRLGKLKNLVGQIESNEERRLLGCAAM
jgi:hypothetical protein